MENKLKEDLALFYDYILFLKENNTSENYLDYSGVLVQASRVISNIYYKPKFFNKKNCVNYYSLLASKFYITDFKHEVFFLKEIKLIENQWRLL
jgi:hypothetical protein